VRQQVSEGSASARPSAIGHPLGASGARIMTTLVNALEQRGGRYGLRTMCEGGGMANATIIERLG
jgi:acetyl-CoA acyltransferase